MMIIMLLPQIVTAPAPEYKTNWPEYKANYDMFTGLD